MIVFDPPPLEIHRQAALWFHDQEVFDFISEHLHLITTHSFRTYLLALELKKARMDWKRTILSRFLSGPAAPCCAAQGRPHVQVGSGTSESIPRRRRRGPLDLFQICQEASPDSGWWDGVLARPTDTRRLSLSEPLTFKRGYTMPRKWPDCCATDSLARKSWSRCSRVRNRRTRDRRRPLGPEFTLPSEDDVVKTCRASTCETARNLQFDASRLTSVKSTALRVQYPESQSSPKGRLSLDSALTVASTQTGHCTTNQQVHMQSLPLTEIGRLGQGEENDLLAGYCADVMVHGHDLDAGDLLDHRLHDWTGRFDQIGPHSLE